MTGHLGSCTEDNYVCIIVWNTNVRLGPLLASGRFWPSSRILWVNRRPFADDIFKCIFLNENELILPKILLRFVPKVRINNIPALVQIMAWRRPGDKPLSEPMMISLLMHICVTRPQWVKTPYWFNALDNNNFSNDFLTTSMRQKLHWNCNQIYDWFDS